MVTMERLQIDLSADGTVLLKGPHSYIFLYKLSLQLYESINYTKQQTNTIRYLQRSMAFYQSVLSNFNPIFDCQYYFYHKHKYLGIDLAYTLSQSSNWSP